MFDAIYYATITTLAVGGIFWLLFVCFLVLNDQRRLRNLEAVASATPPPPPPPGCIAGDLDCEYFFTQQRRRTRNSTDYHPSSASFCFRETQHASGAQLEYYMNVCKRATMLMYWSARAAVTTTRLVCQVYCRSCDSFRSILHRIVAPWYTNYSDDCDDEKPLASQQQQQRFITPPSTPLHMMNE